MPQHIAIIPDGNRRWARAKGLPSFMGHREGANTMERIVETARDLGIPAVTVWGSSVANITNRSKEETKFLFDIFETYFAKLARHTEIQKHNVRVRILGRWEALFPEHTKKAMREAVKQTKNNTARHLSFLMAYSGKEEMLHAIKEIPRGGTVDEHAVKSRLWTKDLPPVDLVIRTGGEPHWSEGFMMWDVAEARLFFTETLWPDFSPEEFTRAIQNYANTERRFGK